MKNVNPWKLAALLAGLVVVFIAVKKFRSPILEGNLPVTLTKIDSASVTEIIITPAKARQEHVRILKSGGWKLMREKQTLRLEQGAGVNMLRMLMVLKPERMVSKRKEKWDELGVGDSTGTRVRLMAGKTVEAELIIGRSGFTQAPGQGYGGSPYTYMRIADEPEVYAIAGFFEAQFNRATDDWRDKSFLRLKKDSITRITFQYPADSSFVLEKRYGKWMMANDLADSTAVIAYLGTLEFRNGQGFASTIPVDIGPVRITFERNAKMLARVEAWPNGDHWTIRSSHQPETYFDADASTGKEILKGQKRFMLKH